MSIWWGRRAHELLGFGTDEQPDGAIVDLDPDAALPAHPLMSAYTDAGNGRVRSVHVSGAVAPTAPPLWYVEHPQTAERPPAMVLIAFSTSDLPDGSVIDDATFTEMDVRNADQAGAIRWWPATGLVHQIYVTPAMRRRGIGTKLLAAAGAYRAARGWAPIWANGERTDLGEVHTRALPAPFQGRLTPRTRVMPPMTPPPDAAGLDRRLLEPDPDV
jgi:GNAT superfamily N-acetyltransferase